jgi:hypothetical protein
VAAGSGVGPERPINETGGQDERFATLIERNSAAILASYQTVLEASRSPDFPDPFRREYLANTGSQVLTELAASVRVRSEEVDSRYKLSARRINDPASRQLCPAECLRAAELFFEVAVASLARYVEGCSAAS